MESTLMAYEGWKNRATWNVSLWLNNDEPIYRGAVEFMKNYKGISPYRTFMRECGLQGQRTPDGILWVSQILDFEELNAMMWELAPEGARQLQ
jgi:hypothetical protein